MSRLGLVGAPVARVAIVSALLLGAGACGDDGADVEPQAGAESSASSASSATPTETPDEDPTGSVPPGAPDCAELWHEGGELPRGYEGCVGADGGYVARDGLSCSSGQFLVHYDDTYYAVAGGTIHESSTSLTDDRDYRSAVRSCRA